MDIYAQFRDRIGRAVSKFQRHADGEGLDMRQFSTVTLTFKDGALESMVIDGEPSARPDFTPAARETVGRARGAANRDERQPDMMTSESNWNREDIIRDVELPTESTTDNEGVDNPPAG